VNAHLINEETVACSILEHAKKLLKSTERKRGKLKMHKVRPLLKANHSLRK
jgi:hypothetical protein